VLDVVDEGLGHFPPVISPEIDEENVA